MQQQSSRRRRATLAGGMVVAVMCLSALSASAHHGWGGYVEALSDLSGTVESSVSLAGPHASMRVRAEGHVWDVVLAPPAGTTRSGLTEGMIPVGDKVIVHGQRHRDAKKYEIKTTRVTWNGKVFKIYPERD